MKSLFSNSRRALLKASVFSAVAACMLSAWTGLAWAQTPPPQPPEVAARAYLLLDVTANQILASRDMDMPVEPASLTKLMSAYLVFEIGRAHV